MFEAAFLAVLLMHARPAPSPPPPATGENFAPQPAAAPTPTPPCASSWENVVPAAVPVPLPSSCSWVSIGAPFVHMQNTPLNAPTPQPVHVLGPSLGGNANLSTALSLQASAFDRTPGTFLAASNAVSKLTVPDYAFGNKWFACNLCGPITSQNEPLATQARIAPQNGPSVVPPQAQLFSTVMDLVKLQPATWSAALVANLDPATEATQSAGTAGIAKGYNWATNTSFDDAYVVFQSSALPLDGNPSNDYGPKAVFSLAGASANHQTAMTFAHASDLVDTMILLQQFDPFSAFQTTVQYGSQMMGSGQTFNLLTSYSIAHTPTAPTGPSGMNPWDPIFGTGVAAHDLNLTGAFTARGANFKPLDGPADALAGMNGFAGEITLFPSSGFQIPYYDAWTTHDPPPDPKTGTPVTCADGPSVVCNQAPMRIDLAGWSYGDVVPRYQNLAASVTELLAQGMGMSAKVSRGYVAASAASSNFAGTALTDALGGQVQIPQSTVGANLIFGGGSFDFANAASQLRYPGSQWSVSAGYAVATQAACNAGVPPCYSSRYGQLTAAITLVGGNGFLNYSLGPANIAVHPGANSQNPNATATSQYGSFLNKNTWNVTTGYHIPAGTWCNSVVATASNAATAPDIVADVPGATLSVAAYAEVVPLQWAVPVVGFIGVAHQIQNTNATSSLVLPGSSAGQFVSTVTYAASFSLGLVSYHNALASNCAVSKPTPTPPKSS